MNCGRIEFKDLAIFSDTGDYDGKPGTLADACILIQHPKGWMLWDTGLNDGLVEHPLEVQEIGATLSVAQSIVSQLSTLHLKRSDIKYVAFSHSHSDHTGNANLFTSATWLMQEKEFRYALSNPTPPYVDPRTISNYKTVKMQLLHGDFDVFGDGRVIILSTPGHTPGHQSLMVQLKEAGTVIFGGDLFHIRENYDQKRVPVGNTSRAETLASIELRNW